MTKVSQCRAERVATRAAGRARLFTGTALAMMVALPGAVRGLELPTGGIPETTAGLSTIDAAAFDIASAPVAFGSPTNIVPDNSAVRLTLDLNSSANAVINWNSFNIAATGRVEFTSTAAAGGDFNVLNRVNGGGPLSQIAGLIDGGVSGRIWIVNESGITFAGSSVVQNTRGLVLSTLGVTSTAFANFDTSGTQFAGAGSAPIQILGGASLGTSGVLVMVAPAIDSAGTLAVGGEAGLFVAADATVTLSAGSNITVSIAAGTPVDTTPLNISGGSLSADKIYAVGLRANDIASALLNVSGSLVAANATATASGIVLSAGRSATNVAVTGTTQGNVTITAAPSVTAGPATEVRARGTITATGIAAPLSFARLDATGDVTLSNTGALNTVAIGAVDSANFSLTSDAAATIAGAVTATGDYLAQAASLTLGTAVTVVRQSAAGALTAIATTGGLDAVGTLTLNANSDGSAPATPRGETLTLDTLTGITGAPNLIAGQLAGGVLTNGTDLRIRTGTLAVSASPITLGNVNAGRIANAVRTVELTPGTYNDALTGFGGNLGNVTVGNLTTTDSVDISTDVTGAIVAGTVTSTAGAVSVRAGTGVLGDALTIAGASSFAGSDVTLLGTTNLNVTGDVTSGRDYFARGGVVTLGAAVTPTLQQARGSILVDGTGIAGAAAAVTLRANSDDAFVDGERIVLDARSGTINAANVSLQGRTTTGARAAVAIRDTVTGVTLGDIDASQLGSTNLAAAIYSATGATLTVPGAVTLGNVATVANLDIVATAGNVRLGGAASSGGSVSVAANTVAGQTLTVGTGSALNGLTLTGIGGVTVTGIVSSGATTSVLSSGGDIVANGVGASLSGADVVVTADTGDAGVRTATATTGSLTLLAGSAKTATLGVGSAVAGDITVGSFDLANLANVTVTGSATAGDDIVLRGAAVTTTGATLTATGAAGADNEANAGATTQGLGNLVGSNISVQGSGTVAAGTAITTGADDVRVVSTGGNATLTSVTAGHDIDVNGLNARLTAGTALGSGQIRVTAGNAAGNTATVGTIGTTGGAINVTGDTITATGVQTANNGALTLTGGAGGITAASLVTTGTANDISATTTGAAGGTVVVTNASSTRDVIVSSSANDATLSNVVAARNVTVTATASGKTATLGTIANTTGNVTVRGGLAAVTATDLNVGGDLLLEAAALLIGTANTTTTLSANGDVTLRATGVGGLTALGHAVVIANADGVDAVGVVTLDSTGAILAASPAAGFLPEFELVGGSAANRTDVRIRLADLTSPVTLGNVTAKRFGSIAAPGDPTGATFATQGAITLGKVATTDALGITSTLGNIAVGGASSSSGGVVVTADAGTLTVGSASTLDAATGDIRLTATANALSITGTTGVATAVSAARDLTARGASVTLGTAAQAHDFSAGRDLVVQTTAGDIAALGAATFTAHTGAPAGSLIFDTRGSITGAANLNNAGGDVRISLSGAASPARSISLGDVVAGAFGSSVGLGALTLPPELNIAGSIRLGVVDVSGADLRIVSGTTLDIVGGITVAGRDIVLSSKTVTQTGATPTTRLSSGRDVQIIATGADPVVPAGARAISVASVVAAQDVTLTATTVAGQSALLINATAGRDIVVNVSANAQLDTVVATRDLGVRGDSFAVTTATAGDDIVLRGVGNSSAGSLTVLGTVGQDSEGGSDVVATFGLAELARSNILVFTQTGDAGVTNATAAAGGARNISVLAGRDAALGTANAGTDITVNGDRDLNASGTASLGANPASTLTAGGAIKGRGEAVTARGTLTGGSLLQLSSVGAAGTGGDADASGAVLRTSLAGGTISVQSTNFAARAGDASTQALVPAGQFGGSVQVVGRTGASLVTGEAGLDIVVTASNGAATLGSALPVAGLGNGTLSARRDITGSGNVTIPANSVALAADGALTAGDDIRLIAVNGNLTTAALTTTGLFPAPDSEGNTPAQYDIVLSAANGTARSTGIVNSVQNYSLTAQSLILDTSIAAQGDLTLIATGSAGITGGAITLTSNSDGVGGGNLTLDSAGAISAATTDLIAGRLVGSVLTGVLTGGADVRIRLVDPTLAIALRDVRADRLGGVTLNGTPPPVYGATQAALQTQGNIAFRDIRTSQSLDIRSFGNAATPSNVSLNSARSTGGSVTLTATDFANQAVTVGTADALTNLTLSGRGSATTTGVTVTGVATSGGTTGLFSSAGDIDAGTAGASLTGANVTVNASARNANVRSATATAGSVTVQANLAATLSSGSASADISVGGGSATLGTGGAGRDIAVTAGGAATIGSASAGRDIAGSGATVVVTSDATAGDDIVLGGGVITATGGTLTATGAGPDSEASGNALFLSNIVVNATGAVNILNAVADAGARSNDIRIASSGATATLTTGNAARDIVVTAGGLATLGTGTAGRDIDMMGGTVTVATSATAGDDIVLVGGAGGVAAPSLIATGAGPDGESPAGVPNETLPTLGQTGLVGSNIVVVGAGTVAIGNATATANAITSRDVRVTATAGDATVAAGNARRDILVSATDAATFGGGSAGRDTTVIADSDLNQSGSATVAGDVISLRNYRVAGVDIVLGTAAAVTQSANGLVDLQASRQLVGLGPLTLRANADGSSGAAAEPLILRAGSALPASGTRSVGFGDTTHLAAGQVVGTLEGRQSDIFIVLGANASGVGLASVDARGLVGGTASGAPFGLSTSANGLLTVSGALDIASITTTENLNLAANGAVNIGAVSVLGRGTGGTTPGLTTTEDNLGIAGDTVSIGFARNFTPDTGGGDIVLTAANNLTILDGRSARDLRLTATAGVISAPVTVAKPDPLLASRDIYVTAPTIGVPTPLKLKAGRSIIVAATGGGAASVLAVTTGFKLLPDLSDFGSVPVTGAGGSSITATGDIDLPDFDIVGSLALTSTGGSVSTGTGVIAHNATADIALSAVNGTVRVGTSTAGRDTSLNGGTVTVDTSVTAGDDIVIVAGAGGVTAPLLVATGAGADSEADVETLLTFGQGNLAKSNVVVASAGLVTVATANAIANVDPQTNTSRDVRIASSGRNATLTTGNATRNIAVVASTAATLATGTAGNDISVTGGSATLGAGTAGRDIFVGANGLATIGASGAGRDLTGSGATIAATGTLTAGDDIVLVAGAGGVTAGQLTASGLGADSEGGNDAAAGTLGQTTLARSNIVIAAPGTALITGVVASARDYRVGGGTVTLGTGASVFDQRGGGRVVLASTDGAVTLLGASGTLLSDASGASLGLAGGLTITAATTNAAARAASVSGSTITLRAATATGAAQANQPAVGVAAAATGVGSVTLARIDGGAVNVTAPVTIAVPLINASGNVSLSGVAAVAGANDTATVSPVLVTITAAGVGAPPVPANITIAGGNGATATVAVASGGSVAALAVRSNTGTAMLTATPAPVGAIASILVESQTGLATIANASAGSIAVRGRLSGSTASVTGSAHAATDLTLAGGTVTVANGLTDNGDIRLAAEGDATLATGTAGRNIDIFANGAATLVDGQAGARISATGGSVAVTTRAAAGDDLVLLGRTSAASVSATGATLTAGGGVDLQGGNDGAASARTALASVAGANYGLGVQVFDVGSAVMTSPLTGSPLLQLGGANIVLSGRDVDFAGGGTASAARDLRIEAGRTALLGVAVAGRDLIASAGVLEAGSLTTGASATAGDDLILTAANGAIVAGGTVLTATGAGPDSEGGSDAINALRADGSALADPTGSGSITRLAGGNIVVAASGTATVNQASASILNARDIRVAANGATTLTTAAARRDLLVLGGSATTTGALTAGDDIAVVARGGTATVATATTTGLVASNEALITDPLRDLSGNALGLPGEAALTRIDGASIVVAASGATVITGPVASAGRYTAIGRTGVTLGVVATPVAQTAARDILVSGSLTAATPANITLLGSFDLQSNSDGVGQNDGIALALANGTVSGAGARLTTGRSAGELLANQGRVTTVATVADGVKGVTLLRVDAPFADFRALNDVNVTDAVFDGGFTLASKAGQVVLATARVSGAVPLITVAERGAVDLKMFGATGATLGQTVAVSDGLLRDVIVATGGGTASVTRAAARDDIVVASTTGSATAATLILAGAPSDSELGAASATLADANGVAIADPYALTGATIASLQGSNIVVSGGAGATLTTATTVAGANDVRVLTLNGPALLTSATTSPARILVGSRNGTASAIDAAATDIVVRGATALLTTGNAARDVSVTSTAGSATATTATAGRDLFVASGGAAGALATLTTGVAGRDATITGPAVVIGSATAGDDVVAAASAGTLTATTLTATGAGSGAAADNEATDLIPARRADGSVIANPAASPAAAVAGLFGSNIVAVASGDVTIVSKLTAARGIQLGSLTGTVNALEGVATAGDISIIAPVIGAPTLTAGGTVRATSTIGSTTLGVTAAAGLLVDAALDAVVLTSATIGNSASLTAGRDILIGADAAAGSTVLTTTAGSATLLAGRNITAFQNIATGTALSATATGGTIGLASFTAGSAATLTAAGDIAVTGLARTGTTLAMTSAGGGLNIGTLAAGTSALLAASTRIVSGATTAGTTLDATSTGGPITLASLSTGNGTTLNAGTDIIVTDFVRTGTAHIAGAAADGNFTATAAAGSINLGSLTAATAATLTANGSAAVVGAAAVGGALAATATNGGLSFLSLDAGGSATLRAATDIVVGQLARSGGLFDARATTGTFSAAALTGGAVLLRSGGATTVANAATAAGSFSATSDTASLSFDSLATGGVTTLLAQTDIGVIGAMTTGGDLTATTTTGSQVYGGVAVTGNVLLAAAEDIAVVASTGPAATGTASATGTLTATATAGKLLLGALTTGGAARLAAGSDLTITAAARTGGLFDARSTGANITVGSLDAGAAATLNAARDIRVTGLGRATGPLTATAGRNVRAGALDAGAATLLAGTDIVVDGDAKTAGALTATATAGRIAAASVTAGGAATLTAATDLQVTGLVRAAGALQARATGGALRLGSLDALSAVLNAQRDLAIDGAARTAGALTATSATGRVTLGSLNSGSDAVLTATANDIVLGGGAAGAAQPTAQTTGKLTLAAATGAVSVNGGVAVGTDYAITAGRLVTLNADGLTQQAARVTITSPDLSLSNTMTLRATDRVQLNVNGAPVTRVALGDSLAASPATSYSLSNTEIGRISAPKLEIDADNGLASTASRTIDIGRATLADTVTQFAVRARGDITLTDTLSYCTGGCATVAGAAPPAAPRILTLGGSLDGGPLDKAVATNPLASTIRVLTRSSLDNATPGTGGQILGSGSTIGLRATYIALGEPQAPEVGIPFVNALLPAVGGSTPGLPLTIEQLRAQYFANATSTFFSAQPVYTKALPTPQASVKAGTLVLAPGQWALIQNTGPSAQIAGGIEVSTLRLLKTGTTDPLIGVFGTIDTRNGVVAAVRISADQLDGITPNNVRINGCIALQSASCILTGVTLPLINLVDPGEALLVSNNAGLALPLDLVTGASNEVLWRDCNDDDEECKVAPAPAEAAPEAAPVAAAPAVPARPTGGR